MGKEQNLVVVVGFRKKKLVDDTKMYEIQSHKRLSKRRNSGSRDRVPKVVDQGFKICEKTPEKAF